MLSILLPSISGFLWFVHGLGKVREIQNCSKSRNFARGYGKLPSREKSVNFIFRLQIAFVKILPSLITYFCMFSCSMFSCRVQFR